MERATIHERLMEIKTLRNRIAHHETLIKRNVEKDYHDLLELIGWISPTTREWVEFENRFPTTFAKPLRKKPKQPKPNAHVGNQAPEVVSAAVTEAEMVTPDLEGRSSD